MRAECVVWTSVDSNLCKTDPTARATKVLPLQAHHIVKLIQDIYRGCQTKVRSATGESGSFNVDVG